MEYITGTFNAFLSVMKTFGVTDVLDVTIVALIIYSLIKLIRETRAEQLVKGILILLLGYVLAYQLNLRMLTTCLDNFFQFGVLALLVVFQPELRSALEQIGRSEIKGHLILGPYIKDEERHIETVRQTIDAVVVAAQNFHESKTGALIVFERKTKLLDIMDTGTLIKAKASPALIGNIFYNKAPLHDGAMIIRDGVIYSAGCILPLTKNESVDINLGTRHRAAMGMSENSDALVLVVSEETGAISIAMGGILTRNYTSKTLREELGSDFHDLGYIICQDNGLPYNRCFKDDHYKKVVEKCGFQYIPWRKLRTTFASVLNSHNVSLKAISLSLGHASPDFTEKVYVKKEMEVQEVALYLKDYIDEVLPAEAKIDVSFFDIDDI